MRLRLAHQISLLMAGAALLAVLAVSLAVTFNLRSGFSDYIRQKDDSQLDRLALLIAKRSASDPTLEWLRASREAMQSLMTEFRGFETPSALRPDPPPPRPLDELALLDPRPRPSPPPPRSPGRIVGWFQIY